jgi:hypothetical protein
MARAKKVASTELTPEQEAEVRLHLEGVENVTSVMQDAIDALRAAREISFRSFIRTSMGSKVSTEVAERVWKELAESCHEKASMLEMLISHLRHMPEGIEGSFKRRNARGEDSPGGKKQTGRSAVENIEIFGAQAFGQFPVDKSRGSSTSTAEIPDAFTKMLDDLE